MASITRPITLKLTGRECQEVFDVEKYVAIAYQQPVGIILHKMVEDEWDSWQKKVSEAPWLKHWNRSQALHERSLKPSGVSCAEYAGGSLPLLLYTTAVWGFGVESWLKGPSMALRPLSKSSAIRVNEPMKFILDRQHVKSPSAERAYLWDDILYRGCGISLPTEFGDLDRWLEPLWAKAQAEYSRQQELKKNSSK